MIEDAGGVEGYEFQRLHGMGEALYEAAAGRASRARPCRVYAPVGGHRDLLAYLVRRLLENGANSSFVSVAADPSVPIAAILRRPQELDRRSAAMRAIRRFRCRAISMRRSGAIPPASNSATAPASTRCSPKSATRTRRTQAAPTRRRQRARRRRAR